MIDSSFEKQTERLILRLYRQTDHEMWRETYSTLPNAQNRWDNGPQPLEKLTMGAFKKVLDNQEKDSSADRFYCLNAFEKDSGSLIGQFSLMDISRVIFQNAYLGYAIYSPYWRKGYGKEAVSAMFDVAFNTLKLHRVEAGIEPHNKRSIALVKSLNMRREGLSKRRLFFRGKWVDMVIYAITVEDLGLEARPVEVLSS